VAIEGFEEELEALREENRRLGAEGRQGQRQALGEIERRYAQQLERVRLEVQSGWQQVAECDS
jgi:hypothetical protein